MLKKPWFLFVLFLGWCWLCLQWYCCWMQVACPGCSNEMPNPYAIGFQLNKATPDLGRKFDKLVTRITEQPEGQSQFEITGKYYTNEKQGKQLGEQRAKAIANEIAKRYSLGMQPILRSQKVWDTAPASDSFFQAIDLQWVEILKPSIPLEKLFFFERSISEMQLASEELEYLRTLADYLKNRSNKVLVEGHADNSGLPERNAELALERANFIAVQLIDFGVKKEQLIIENKSHSMPMVNNSTEANRARNRRVFLKVIE